MSRPAPLEPNEPPNDRDKAIFQSAVAEGQSAAEIAREHNLSTSRVRRIVRYVERHYALRQWAQEPHAVLVARKLRLEHLWREALAAWQRSQQDEQVQKSGKHGEQHRAEVVRRSRTGEVKFLDLARRLTFDLDAVNAALFEQESHSPGAGNVEDLTFDQRRKELHTNLLAAVLDAPAPPSAGASVGSNPLPPTA